MPSLRSLELPASELCGARWTLRRCMVSPRSPRCVHFSDLRELDEYTMEPVEEVGEWVLDLSRLPTLTFHLS